MDSELIRDIWVITQVILLDLALGGDNSIIIGMAAKNLPHDLRRKAILYGTAGAILYALSWLPPLSYYCKFPT